MSDTSMLTESYRPYKLDDIVGQEKAKKTIGSWIRTGRLPRSILITGALSVGKTTSARIIGRSVLCSEPENGNACGKCRNCKSFDAETHPDYIEVDAASDRGIDAMRTLTQRLAMMPLQGKKKVIVLDECHAVTPQAFQAMLKTLEEPPAHCVIMLVTTNPEKLPATIVSRCSKLQLTNVSVEDCTELLLRIVKDKKLAESGISDKHLRKIATATGAHPRNALHALDQVYTMVLDADQAGQSVDTALVNSFIQQVAVSDVDSAALAIARGVLEGKPGGAMKRAEDMRSESDILLTKVSGFMRQAMMFTVNSKLMDPYYKEALAELPILAPESRHVILDAYEVFTKLRIECSNHMVPVGEVLDAAIARSALICQKFLKSQAPVATNTEVKVVKKEVEDVRKEATAADDDSAMLSTPKKKSSAVARFPD
jgi:DNA polymerase III subunit gamma/tau